jgi:hypothetical protein
MEPAVISAAAIFGKRTGNNVEIMFASTGGAPPDCCSEPLVPPGAATPGQKFIRLGGRRRGVWYVTTDHGQHRVMFANQEAVPLFGDRDEIVARVPAPEAD